MSGVLSQLRDLPLLFKDPKRYAATRTLGVRQAYWNVFACLNYPEWSRRRRLAQELQASPGLPQLPRDKGFLKADFLDPKLVNSVVEEARAVLRETDLAGLDAKLEHPHVSIPINHRVTPGSPFYNFALNPDLLKVVTDYLGMLPVIQCILLTYSPNRRSYEGTSQYYHLDAQDQRLPTARVHIEDVDEENGPLTIIDASESHKLARAVAYRKHGSQRRISDEVARSVVDPSGVHNLTGKAGSVYLVDTDRCFHYGSREGKRPRFIMDFAYFSPFAFVLPWKWRKGLPFAEIEGKERLSTIERHVLGAV